MASAYPVFTAEGDARAELDTVLGELEVGSDEAGLQKALYVERAGMTVVTVRDRECPLARALRNRSGWSEPREG